MKNTKENYEFIKAILMNVIDDLGIKPPNNRHDLIDRMIANIMKNTDVDEFIYSCIKQEIHEVMVEEGYAK